MGTPPTNRVTVALYRTFLQTSHLSDRALRGSLQLDLEVRFDLCVG